MTDTNLVAFNQRLCDFIDASPTTFHAVKTMTNSLDSAGFIQLDERQSWANIEAGQYYVTRNDSSLIAFTLPDTQLADVGFKMMGHIRIVRVYM